MCLQIRPARSNILALQVWAIKTKEEQSVFHYLPGFKQDSQLRVFVNEILFIELFI